MTNMATPRNDNLDVDVHKTYNELEEIEKKWPGTKANFYFCPCRRYLPEVTAISCSACEGWFHLKCVGIDGLDKKALESIKWTCPRCLPLYWLLDSTPRARDEVRAVADEVVSSAIEKAVNEIKADVVDVCTKTFAEAIQSQADSSPHAVKTEKLVENATAKVLDRYESDRLERERRKSNLCVMNIAESNAEESRERGKDDLKACIQLGIKKSDIVSTFRAGDPSAEKGPRPLIVKMKDETTANFYSMNGRGKKTDSGHYINRDLCKADRHAMFMVRQARRQSREQAS